MTTWMPIGEFSKLTLLSVKTLHHYHEVGVLTPDIDPANGYRCYTVEQVATGHLVRRLRQLEMPLADIRAVLDAPDQTARSVTLLAHLRRMEQALSATQQVVASLRLMLEEQAVRVEMQLRRVGAAAALVVEDRVERAAIGGWCEQAFGVLFEVVAARELEPTGPPGVCYSEDWFMGGGGGVVAYVPTAGAPPTVGRCRPSTLPGGTFAVALHEGPYEDLDRTYGALGSEVAARGIGASGAIREQYLVGPTATDEEAGFRTEICWPIHDEETP